MKAGRIQARRKARMLAVWRALMPEPCYQPKQSRICGQIAVATIVGRPLIEVLERFGHTNGTTHKQLTAVLESYGFETSKALLRFPGALCIGKMRWAGTSHSHWVIVKEGGADIFDCEPRESIKELWKSNPQVGSYLHIRPPKGTTTDSTDVPLPPEAAPATIGTVKERP